VNLITAETKGASIGMSICRHLGIPVLAPLSLVFRKVFSR
jgi:hypothetical protein